MLEQKYSSYRALWDAAKGKSKLSGSASSRNRLNVPFYIPIETVGLWQSFTKEVRSKDSKEESERCWTVLRAKGARVERNENTLIDTQIALDEKIGT